MGENNNSRGNFARFFNALVGAIFVAIIANALWEFLLRDAIYSGYIKAASSVGEVFHSYLDSLYKGIGNPSWYRLVAIPFVLVICTIVFVNFYGIYRAIKVRVRAKALSGGPVKSYRDPSFLDRRFWAMSAMFVFNIVCYSELALSTTYRAAASIWVDQSIEIIHPYITEQEFLILRSRYRSISEANDFYLLYGAIRKYETEKKIKLFEFEPIGLPEKSS